MKRGYLACVFISYPTSKKILLQSWADLLYSNIRTQNEFICALLRLIYTVHFTSCDNTRIRIVQSYCKVWYRLSLSVVITLCTLLVQ